MRKSALIFLASTLLTAALGVAQTAPAAPQGPRHARAGHDRVFQQLNLTADQKTQFQQLMQDQRTQMKALRANNSLTPEQRQQQIKALREANHQKMMALLTPDQQAQFKQLRQQRRGDMKAGGGHRARGLEALNLTQQQKEQIKPIFQSTRQQMQALRNDTSLTPEQRHQKLQEIRQNQQAQLKSILTPEQIEQLQQMRQHRGRRGQGGQSSQTPPPQGF